MRISRLIEKTADATGVKSVVMYMLVISLSCNFLTLLIFLFKGDTHRETLVPPSINQSFWVEDERVSDTYLVQMGIFMSNLYFNVTPDNVDFNHEQLLKYISSKTFGKMDSQLKIYSERIKNERASTNFSVTDVIPDEKNQRVAFIGVMDTFLGRTHTSKISKIYVFSFGQSGGKTLLIDVRESKNASKPFDN